MKFTVLAASLCLCLPVSALGQTAGGLDCEGGGSYSDLLKKAEGGAKLWHATNPDSTATGAYQFTFGTLKELGFIKSGALPAFGEGSWAGVEWTGKGGVYSRDDFFNNQAAQDLALSDLTTRNLETVSSDWSEGMEVDGVPMTAGGVAFATHMLGAGGFKQWAASGFTPAGLDADRAAEHNMSLDEYQNHFVKRLAEGGCMDPGMISSGAGNGDVGPMAEVGLMPWGVPVAAAIIMPGDLQSLTQPGS